MTDVIVIKERETGHIRGVCKNMGIAQKHINFLKSKGFPTIILEVDQYKVIDEENNFWRD